MAVGMLEMPKREETGRGRGRPKGSTRGRLEDRFSVKVSPEYKTWFIELSDHVNGEMADVFREAMRKFAEDRKFRPPPLR